MAIRVTPLVHAGEEAAQTLGHEGPGLWRRAATTVGRGASDLKSGVGTALRTAKPVAAETGRILGRGAVPAVLTGIAEHEINDPYTQEWLDHNFGPVGPAMANFGRAKVRAGPMGQYALTGAMFAAPQMMHYGGRFGTMAARDAAGEATRVPRPGMLGSVARAGERWGTLGSHVIGAGLTGAALGSARQGGAVENQHIGGRNVYRALKEENDKIRAYNAARAQTLDEREARLNAGGNPATNPGAAPPAAGAGGGGAYATYGAQGQGGYLDNIRQMPNWAKALGVGGAALGGGYLLNRLTGGNRKEEDEDEEEGSVMPGLGTAAGLGGLGLGLGYLSDWNYKNLADPNWWSKTGAARVPLSAYKYAAPNLGPALGVSAAIPGLPRPPAPMPPGTTPDTPANLTGEAGKPLAALSTALAAGPLGGPFSALTPHVAPKAPSLGEGATRPARLDAWRAGQQVHLTPGDVPGLNTPELSTLASDPRQQQYARPEGMGLAKGTGPTPATGPAGATRPAPAGAAQAAGRPAAPGAAQPAGKPATPAAAAEAGKLTPLAQKALMTHFNGDPNAAQQAAWQKLQEHAQQIAPPEVKAQGPQGFMEWVSAIWNGMDDTQKVLLGTGLGLGAIGLMGMMGGGKDGGGMGMAGPLLGIGGLGLAGYMGYNAYNKVRGQTDQSGGLDALRTDLADPVSPRQGLLSQKDVNDRMFDAHHDPKVMGATIQHFARHTPEQQAHVRGLFQNQPEQLADLNKVYAQGADLRGRALDTGQPPGTAQPGAASPGGQAAPAEPAAPAAAAPTLTPEQITAETQQLSQLPAAKPFFSGGGPNKLAILNALQNNPDALAPVVQAMSPGMRQHTLGQLQPYAAMIGPAGMAAAQQLMAQAPAPGGAGTANPNEPAGQPAGEQTGPGGNVLADDAAADKTIQEIIGMRKPGDPTIPPAVSARGIEQAMPHYTGEDVNRLLARIGTMKQQYSGTDTPSQVARAGLDELQRKLVAERTQYLYAGLNKPEGYQQFWKSPQVLRDHALQQAGYALGTEELPDIEERVKQKFLQAGGQGEPDAETAKKLREQLHLEASNNILGVAPEMTPQLQKLLAQGKAYKGLPGILDTYKKTQEDYNAKKEEAAEPVFKDPALQEAIYRRQMAEMRLKRGDPSAQRELDEQNYALSQGGWGQAMLGQQNAVDAATAAEHMASNANADFGPNGRYGKYVSDPYGLPPEEADKLYQQYGPERLGTWVSALQARNAARQQLAAQQYLSGIGNGNPAQLAEAQKKVEAAEAALKGFPSFE
jgi:hypothetical protein